MDLLNQMFKTILATQGGFSKVTDPKIRESQTCHSCGIEFPEEEMTWEDNPLAWDGARVIKSETIYYCRTCNNKRNRYDLRPSDEIALDIYRGK